ncbi:uncharacterized protein [Cicer arietinum]|uniref:Dof zinc finger protein n=1 Tax=Cicer arietinum TaxID=3827 RepID=A0A1S2YHT2_CICAR|nr:dof zinc finger protein DOF1.4-like [Cicer arietinum]
MGLSSKQVSSSGLDNWKQNLLESQDLELPKPHHMMRKHHQQQQQQQQTEQVLKCPRCESTNTKFCYYNNYNKSQPRHFCRACKRHWTKGGTLRNVPVGGGRKNKRVKKSNTPITSSTTKTTTTATNAICTPSISNMNGNGLNSNMTIQTPLGISDQKSNNIPSSLYQALIHPPSLFLQQSLMNTRDLLESKDFGIGNGIFTSTSCSTYPILPQNQSLLFPFSTSSSFDTTTCPSSNVYYYGEEFKTMEEPTINSIVPSTKPWEMSLPGTTTAGMETSKYWNWEDIDSLVSTDLKDPWDDSDIKP